jgi:pSer/pThr/pTyr-binding forkhead associated (FHA) protein
VPSLFVIRGSDQGAKIELDQDVVALGRDASNSIQINDQEVSRHHA